MPSSLCLALDVGASGGELPAEAAERIAVAHLVIARLMDVRRLAQGRDRLFARTNQGRRVGISLQQLGPLG